MSTSTIELTGLEDSLNNENHLLTITHGLNVSRNQISLDLKVHTHRFVLSDKFGGAILIACDDCHQSDSAILGPDDTVRIYD